MMYKHQIGKGDFFMHSKAVKNKNAGMGLLKAAVIGFAVIAALLAVYAKIITENSQAGDRAKLVSILIIVIGSLVCGVIAGKIAGRSKTVNGLISGALMSAIIIIALIIVCGDDINYMSVCEILLISVGVCAISSSMHLCNSNKKLRYKSKHRNK